MRQILRPAALIAIAFWFHPAFAQMAPGTNALGSGPAPTPQAQAPDVIPPALPGISNTGGIATAPKLKKANVGDPTTNLFTAINSGNYGDAQDAISRGADLDAQNTLGETPLDLSIALNQKSITFMILSVRNEGGGAPPPAGTVASLSATSKAKTASVAKPKIHSVPVRLATTPAPAPTAKPSAPAPSYANDPGQANVSVGFLGFGQK